MIITISENSKDDLRLRLPTGLAINRAVAAMVAAKLKKHNVEISARQLNALFRAFLGQARKLEI